MVRTKVWSYAVSRFMFPVGFGTQSRVGKPGTRQYMAVGATGFRPG